jgi:hypothetical protein
MCPGAHHVSGCEPVGEYTPVGPLILTRINIVILSAIKISKEVRSQFEYVAFSSLKIHLLGL